MIPSKATVGVVLALTWTALGTPSEQALAQSAPTHADPPAGEVSEADAQVRAVLFYSPRCPHCHDVMQNHLPPLMERYGGALSIVAVNVDTSQGQALYQATARHLRLPANRTGVPALLVGETLLVGSAEIPARLPSLLAEGLADGGIGWPPVPQIRSYLTLQGLNDEASVELEPWMLGTDGSGGGLPSVFILGRDGEAAPTSARDRFMRDPLGNGIAVAVLLGMVALLIRSVRTVMRPRSPLTRWPAWAVPALALMGAGIAGYLAFVEVSGTPAVCGPVGDCNAVQQSPWASIAGVPVGLLGLVGYLTLAGLSVAARGRGPGNPSLPLALWALVVVGMAASITLTFLEPFVIGATCAWCVGSAVVMTLILLGTTPEAVRARGLRGGSVVGSGQSIRKTREVTPSGRAPATTRPERASPSPTR